MSEPNNLAIAVDTLTEAEGTLEVNLDSKTPNPRGRNAKSKNNAQEMRVFSQAIKMSLDGIIIGTLDGNITYVNDALLKMHGTADKNDLLGKHVLEFICERDRERATRNSLECLKTGEGMRGEFAALRKNGDEFPVEVTTAIIRNEQGMATGFIDVVRDVTERKKTEEALSNSEEKYRSLFANMMNGFAYCQMIFDKKDKPVDFVYIEVNDAFERLTGLRKVNVLGKKATEAIPGIKEAHPELFEIYGKVASTGKGESFKINFKPLGIWLSISVYSPKKGFFAAVFENITEQIELTKRVEEYSKGLEFTVSERTKELVETQERLLKAERLAAIGELAGMVGHDLRNPLTGIKNAVYFLRKKQGCFVGDAGNAMLTVIDESVERANKIVNDLFDYGREIPLELEKCSPKSLMDGVLTLVQIPNHIKVLNYTQTHPTIWVDANKMQRVFLNLVRNAVEAMLNGGTLEIKSRLNGASLEFAFADTGTGMSEDTMTKAFTPLFTTKAQGMGFGLSVCKRIVEAHGGKIRVTSALGKGTIFTILLPLESNPEGGGEKD